MRNISVLVVEDDISLIEQLKEYFEIFFDLVYVAKDAYEGYSLFKKYCPDIIVTDINMPGMERFRIDKKDSSNQ